MAAHPAGHMDAAGERTLPNRIRHECGAGGEDAAGDGAGFFPHLRGVCFGGYVPQVHCGVVEDGHHAVVGRVLPLLAAATLRCASARAWAAPGRWGWL